MIFLFIPSLPPSSNHAYFNIRGGRALTKEGQKYKNETIAWLTQNFPHELKELVPDTPYFVYARFFFDSLETEKWLQEKRGTKQRSKPLKRKILRYKRLDVSNRLKLFEDCLKDAGGIDDSQFFSELIEKRVGRPDQPEYTEVFIWNMEKEENILERLSRL